MEFAGDGDTSVCISTAKLPFEAGGKEDMGKERATRRIGGGSVAVRRAE